MKNISYVINGVLAVAIIILFILFFTSKSSTSEGTPVNFVKGDSTGVLPIAYVNVDSLLLNYNLAKDANEDLMKEYTSSTNSINQMEKRFQAEVADFQKKAQNNAFISQERAEQESRRIQQLEANLRQSAQSAQEKYMQKQAGINNRITDSVRVCLKDYNKTANYQVIFSNSGLDNILLAKEAYDITNDIVKVLNSRYKPEAAK